MEVLIPYLIKVNISIAMLCLLYKFVFMKDTFFKARRWYLLGSVLFSFIYPFLAIDGLGVIFNLKSDTVATNEIVSIGELSTMAIMDEVATTPIINWILILKVLLAVITIFFLSRLLWQLFVIIRIKKDTVQQVLHDIHYQRMNEKSTPFSFFKWIFVYPEAHSDEKLKQILIHEHMHVKQWHSIDVMVMEVLTVLFWYNPFFWIMKKEMAINLEYIADSGVLDEGINRRDYQYHLLHLTYPRGNIQLVNNFNVSQLKQRIIMMNGKKTPMKNMLKYIIVLPAVLLLVTANSVFAQNKEPQKEEIKNSIQVLGIKYGDMPSDFKKLTNSGSKPLIIIDGEKMDKDFDLSQVKPENIESVSVLKDSSAREIYGEDGKNGVIIISSKKSGEVPTINDEGDTTTTVRIRTKDTSIPDPLVVVDGEVKGKGSSIIDEITPDDIESISVIKDETGKATYGEQGKDGVILITTKTAQAPQKKETTKSKSDDEPFLVVEEQPEFIGGMAAMMKFLGENIKYPKEAQDKGFQGRVVVSFIIEKDGSVTSSEVVRSVDSQLDLEAKRVIESMPKWKPGKQKGEVVRVKYTLPIVFKLPPKAEAE